ncbi:MAG: hypothetical protein Q8P73_05545 [bacterium]|nr:hypothetical protein [bacterium]
MVLSVERRNEIAWQYLIFQIRESGLHYTNFNAPDTRQQIRVTAEKIGASFEEAMEFVQAVLAENNS